MRITDTLSPSPFRISTNYPRMENITINYGDYPYGVDGEQLTLEYKEYSLFPGVNAMDYTDNDCRELKVAHDSQDEGELWTTFFNQVYSHHTLDDLISKFGSKYLSIYFNMCAERNVDPLDDFKLVIGLDDFGKAVGFPMKYATHLSNDDIIDKIVLPFMTTNLDFIEEKGIVVDLIRECVEVNIIPIEFPRDVDEFVDFDFDSELAKLDLWKEKLVQNLRHKMTYELRTDFYKRSINSCLKCPNFISQFKSWLMDLATHPYVQVDDFHILENVIEFVSIHLTEIDHPIFGPGEIRENKGDKTHLAYWVTRFREEKMDEVYNTYFTNPTREFGKGKPGWAKPRPYMKWLYSRPYDFFYRIMDDDVELSVCEITFKFDKISQIVEEDSWFSYKNTLGQIHSRIRRMGSDGPYNE